MNLANRLTLARIFLVPIFMMILISKIPYGKFIAAAVFILAASTDGLDGYVARKKNQITRLGKFMDPLADKLLVSAALISLVELREIPAWVAVIIIGREFAVTGLRAIAAAEGVVIAASKLGKYKTVSQIVAIAALFLENYPFSLWKIPFGNIAMAVAVIFTIWSGVDYFLKTKHILRVGIK
ncbi:MAG: CDP-diacylglycerol--glycerol-3-phosphate 3-phosphatidyltransferase [Clostridia bacterium]|nr:CDP-diacylglycerol--glycerol-3-phosphate 3-phosphatidyltransferase [Clostridia bacterium]